MSDRVRYLNGIRYFPIKTYEREPTLIRTRFRAKAREMSYLRHRCENAHSTQELRRDYSCPRGVPDGTRPSEGRRPGSIPGEGILRGCGGRTAAFEAAGPGSTPGRGIS